MKAFAPAILLALAGATSACTFAYESAYNAPMQSHYGHFAIYYEDDIKSPSDGTQLAITTGAAPSTFTSPNFKCQNAEGDHLGAKYRFCMEGTMGADGKVDGGITVQRLEDGEVVNIRDGGKEEVVDGDSMSPVRYWKSGVGCPEAKLP